MKVQENMPLSDIVYYRIGGKARFVVRAVTKDELIEAIRFAKSKHLEILILGLGSNILLPDEDFPGVVIVLAGNGTSFAMSNDSRISAFVGETMDDLIKFAFDHSLLGLEWAGGLPSTVGGAIRGNAGAFGTEIKENVLSIEAVDTTDPQLRTKTFSLAECRFSYRDSYFKQHPELIIVSALFALQKGTKEEVSKAREIYQKNIDYRQTHHPMEYPSCGSVFKNITQSEEVEKILSIWPDVRELSHNKWHDKVSMGYIINRLGFAGKRIGGAMVSPKHTNYIVNVDHAKAQDVRQLVEEIKSSFEQTFGFSPEPELMIIENNLA
ncbi:MAG TPA: UDP-N-acetylmuramate dehydrogenase [Patescibacteria group bacterium]|nr:UDP-N-acetylmuramate dehydrogenase [Patescibacteria group bacterium]